MAKSLPNISKFLKLVTASKFKAGLAKLLGKVFSFGNLEDIVSFSRFETIFRKFCGLGKILKFVNALLALTVQRAFEVCKF